MDTDQTGTRVRLHNSSVGSYDQAIYDWVAFISTGKKSGRGKRESEREAAIERVKILWA